MKASPNTAQPPQVISTLVSGNAMTQKSEILTMGIVPGKLLNLGGEKGISQ